MTDSWAVVMAALIGFLASPLGTWFTSHLSERKERNSRNRDARYLASRIAVVLEQFALQCTANVPDKKVDEFLGIRPSYNELPELNYPAGVDWRILDVELVTRAISLPSDLIMSAARVEWHREIDPEHLAAESCDQCARCGYIAWELAVDIRQKYNLPLFKPIFLNPGDLKSRHDQLVKYAKSRQAE